MLHVVISAEGEHEQQNSQGAYETAHDDRVPSPSPADEGDDAVETGDLGGCARHSAGDAFERGSLVCKVGSRGVGLSASINGQIGSRVRDGL